jgi:uncharacterized membrane protein
MQMFKLKSEWPLLLVLAVSFGLLIYGWVNLPATIPVHWGIDGKIDGYASKELHTLFMSIMLLGIYVGMLVVPKFDPRKEQYALFERSYRTLRFLILAIIAVINTVVILVGLGYEISVSKVILLTISVMLIVIGNLMGKIRQNYFVGIRTPWTLQNEEVWNKTHRFGGWVFVAAGLISLIGLLVPDAYAFGIFITTLMVSIVWIFVYSYQQYAKLKDK